MIPLFKHLQNLFPDVDGQHLSTVTMRPILRIPQCPSEDNPQSKPSERGTNEISKFSGYTDETTTRYRHSLFPIQK